MNTTVANEFRLTNNNNNTYINSTYYISDNIIYLITLVLKIGTFFYSSGRPTVQNNILQY